MAGEAEGEIGRERSGAQRYLRQRREGRETTDRQQQMCSWNGVQSQGEREPHGSDDQWGLGLTDDANSAENLAPSHGSSATQNRVLFFDVAPSHAFIFFYSISRWIKSNGQYLCSRELQRTPAADDPIRYILVYIFTSPSLFLQLLSVYTYKRKQYNCSRSLSLLRELCN